MEGFEHGSDGGCGRWNTKGCGGLALLPPPHSVILAKAGIHFDLCAPFAALKN